MYPKSTQEQQIEQLRQERELILSHVDNAIALFDPGDRLVMFNHKLEEIWGLSAEWLRQQPTFGAIATELQQGSWSEAQCHRIQQVLREGTQASTSFDLGQVRDIYLEAYVTLTSSGGRLFAFRDVTSTRKYQASLNSEVKRLSFLLGLMERLNTSVEELREVGQYALNYLVTEMEAAFGDVKVVHGKGKARYANPLSNAISGQFIATYGDPAVLNLQEILERGIPYGQGLLWQVVETGVPVFVEDYQNHPQSIPGFRHPGIGQLGIFPIPAADGTYIGVLTLESRNLKKLQQAPQQDMLLAACRTLGVAIERAQAQQRLREMNRSLERASQMKSEFLASMSHELRTPLNSILGFSELLKREVSGTLNQRQHSYVQAIERSGGHLLDLLNDILDLSKVEAGKMELELQPVSVRDLCDQCIRMMQPRAKMKKLTLSLEVDYRLDRVLLDERRSLQIVINLLSNAVKFTPERGTVKLTARWASGKEIEYDVRPDRSAIDPDANYLCLEVIDSGIGVPEDKRHLLFQPFQQIDSSLNRKHEGTGLGLALTRRLSELHGGTVSFRSREDCQGSIFQAWLPLLEVCEVDTTAATGYDDPQQEGRSPGKLTEMNAQTRRILVVEDQPSNQALIAEVLELEGYAVELISDGKTMQDTIQSPLITPEMLPHLVLMDIQLPEVDGFELIRQMKAHTLWQQVPTIAVTAMAMTGDGDRCLQAGADGYISKPINISQLVELVRSLAHDPPEDTPVNL